MIKRLLIANRGEIALRIIKTCQRLGIYTVAVYSDADRQAQHTLAADSAVYIGPSNALDSYLNVEKIIEAAQSMNVDAIHPGYGFLAEKSVFAKACASAGIRFVGPSATVIEQMGQKDEAKKLMSQAGVPVIPGYNGDDQSIDTLINEAKRIGLPVMIKATFGGGGKGMRIIFEEDELKESIESAKRESLKSFGSDHVILEKYLESSRHIEVQIIGDTHGNYLHFYERDCSIQRRHQKVIEEAPAINVPDDIREKLHQVALQGAKSIGYVNAGTFEFLFANDAFYFLEMNTRLQVEHPVTEAITGIDLVELQLMVANGDPLPLSQADVRVKGHAFEARIYAEDPFNDFLPATGRIESISMSDLSNIRVDSGVVAGDVISIYYDPMIAKIISFDQTRAKAMARLNAAMNETEVFGLATNCRFIGDILGIDAFQSAPITTKAFETQQLPKILERQQQTIDLLPLAVLAMVEKQRQSRQDFDQDSPWQHFDAWMLNGPQTQSLELDFHGKPIHVTVQHLKHDALFITSNDLQVSVDIRGQLVGDTLTYETSNARHQAKVVFYGHCIHVFANGQSQTFTQITHDYQDTHALDEDALTAPMPGVITNIWVKPGEKVKKGDKLCAMEAMKMEHTLSAQADGQIESVLFAVGDQIEQGSQIFEIKNDE